jgi:RNA polymerase sigma-70 factor (ECF subfamily)
MQNAVTPRLEDHRVALTGHCYRMLGSASEADDAVQETMVRAWKSQERFEERSSLRTWLTRIATNVCLDALADRKRRGRPIEIGEAGSPEDALDTLDRVHWLEPIPDERAVPADADPSEIALLRESIRLAFVAALQHLPPRQRAALLLGEVLGWPVSEVATTLEMTPAAVNSALQRARSTLAERDPGTSSSRAKLTREQTELVERYAAAFERYDIDALVSMLREDGTLSMPPFCLWLRGRETIRTWLGTRGLPCRGSRLVRTAASGAPAFGQYRVDPEGGFKAWALIVLELDGAQIGAFNSFLDVETLFPLFGLPLRLEG